VPNISEADRKEIEGKKIDKLDSIIDVMKKYKVLDRLGHTIYDDFHKLRKFRNKVQSKSQLVLRAFQPMSPKHFRMIFVIGLSISRPKC
jgi:hypothetical protein